jgi:hypothetical protein
MSDFDGNFELNVNDGEILVISFIGYLTQEVTIDNRSTYNIVLQDDVPNWMRLLLRDIPVNENQILQELSQW